MNFRQRTSTAIMAIAVIAGVGLISSGQTMTSAYGLQQPFIAEPTPFNPPTTTAPPASTLAHHMCMPVTLDPQTATSGPGGSYIWDMVDGGGTAPTTVAEATSFTGWCAAANTDAMDPNDVDTANPCWVQNGIGYYGSCTMVKPDKGYEQTDSSFNGGIPTEQWLDFTGTVLKPGQFLDLEDTTPYITTSGHMAMVIPCDKNGTPQVRLYEGIIDTGVFTLQAPDMEYLQQISDTKNGICAYHFDIGAGENGYVGDSNGHPAQTAVNNPYGVTDFVLVNTSGKNINLDKEQGRFTSTFSVTTGFFNKMG